MSIGERVSIIWLDLFDLHYSFIGLLEPVASGIALNWLKKFRIAMLSNNVLFSREPDLRGLCRVKNALRMPGQTGRVQY